MRTGRLNLRFQISNLRFQISNLKLATAGCAVLGMTIASRGAAPSEQDLCRAALAEEFASAGVQAVNRQQVVPAMIRQSAALLKAACEEYNVEPRFPRLLADACLNLKDTDGEIAALMRYRAIGLSSVQNDQFAQVRLIDLVTSRMESLDKKLDYLTPLLGVAQLPDPVKSHIAWVCSRLLTDKFDTKGAEAMLAKALALNPLSPEALQSEYESAEASGSPQKQAAALVGLLKSNPAQPAVMGTLADDLASVDEPDLAVTWYKRSFALSQQLGLGLDPGRYLNYAAALFAMDQAKNSGDAASMLVAGQPSNIGAATIALLAARESVKPQPGGAQPADPSVVQRAQDVSLAALTAQMGTLHAILHGVTGAATTQAATTQPMNVVGDISDDAPKVRNAQNRPGLPQRDVDFCRGYSASLVDLVFYYTYFDSQPAIASQLLDAMRLLRPAGDAELTRLEGFAFLANGKPDEAKVKFSAIADHDPLSKMGLLLMAPSNAQTAADASKLVTDHPAGVLGAILLEGLRDKGAKPSLTADSTAVANEAAAFPMKFLDLLNTASTDSFYDLVAQPLHVSVGYDEPALARVTIKNVGDYDLSVGPDGAIRPDLFFDVATQGGNNPFYPGVAYDRIAGPLVLKAHQLDQPGTDQVIRVDTGKLSSFLETQPTIAVTMLFSVYTNPVGQQAGVAPGPGGYRKQFTSPMERRANPVSTQKQVQDLLDPAMNGRPDQKIHLLELLVNYTKGLREKIAHLQGQLSAPAPDANQGAGPAGNAVDGGGGLLPPPPVNAEAPPPIDSKELQTQIQIMQGLDATFTAALRNTLRDPEPLVRYWAEAKLGQLSDAATRRQTAMNMLQGKDWQERLLGLILGNDLPKEQAKGLAQTLKNDPVLYVKDFADATIELADLPTTQPAAGAGAPAAAP
jgi:hypothetical protein